jgi:uncharacterized surface protein with fasciclin (FAS1) repeats
MSKRLSLIAAAAALALTAGTAVTYSAAMAENTITVGGAPMYPSKNIIQNAVNSKDHTTLVAAVKAAGLVDTLQGPGPFTVFAPTNAAFAKLPAGTVDNLLKPENKGTLTTVLTYHVVPGRMTALNLMKAVKDGEGEAKLKTVAGDWIVVKQAGPGKLTVTDDKGDVAMVTIADVLQSNGVIHVIDTVSSAVIFAPAACSTATLSPHSGRGLADTNVTRACSNILLEVRAYGTMP